MPIDKKRKIDSFGNEYIDANAVIPVQFSFRRSGSPPRPPQPPRPAPPPPRPMPPQPPRPMPPQPPRPMPPQPPRPAPPPPRPMPPPPPHGHDNNGAPNTPPPAFVPIESNATTFALDPGAVSPCLFQFSYIWPRRGQPFWAWVTFVGRRSFGGFRWSGRNWNYFAMDLRDVRSIQCF